MEIAERLNKLRAEGYENLTAFHFVTKELTNEDEWEALMKAFNKEVSVTPH